LPEPFGPITPMQSRSSTVKEMPANSGTAPNCLVRACALRIGGNDSGSFAVFSRIAGRAAAVRRQASVFGAGQSPSAYRDLAIVSCHRVQRNAAFRALAEPAGASAASGGDCLFTHCGRPYTIVTRHAATILRPRSISCEYRNYATMKEPKPRRWPECSRASHRCLSTARDRVRPPSAATFPGVTGRSCRTRRP
jgi:hypothetical protein